MTAVEVLSMTQPPYARLSTGRLPCIPCRRPWGIVAERLHAVACRALGRPPAHRAHRPQTNGKHERFIRTRRSQDGPWCDLPQQRRAHRRP